MYKQTPGNILLLLFTTCWLPCFCQEFPVFHITKQEGLPSNVVYQVYRDHTGFLWFATDKGIARYNGVRFETFTTFNGLTDNDVINFFEDHYGRLWLNSFKGSLCYYNYKDGKIYSPANSTFLNLPFRTSHVSATSFEKDSSFTILFADRQLFVNIKGETWHVYYLNRIQGMSPYELLTYVSKRSPATYEVITVHGSILIDTNYNVLKGRLNEPFSMYKCRIGQYMTYLASDKTKTIYRDHQPVYYFGGQYATFENMNSLYVNKTDTFLGTENGLIINHRAPLLKGNRISDVSQDIAGNYWVSTLNNGVYHFSKHFSDLKFYGNSYEGVIRFAFADKGTLFFTNSDQHLFRFEKGKATRIFDLSGYRNNADENIVEPGYVTDDHADYHFLWDREHFILQNLHADKPLIKREPIIRSPVNHLDKIYGTKGICSTPQYIYMVHSGYFILRLDLLKIRSGYHAALEDVTRSTNGQRIYAMAKHMDNTIWFSTSNGMYKIVQDSVVLQPSFKGLSLHQFYVLGEYMVGWNNSNKLIICNQINGRMAIDTVPTQDCIWDKAWPLDNERLLISTNKQYRILHLKPSAHRPVYELSTVSQPFIPADAEHIFSDGHTCYFFRNGNITAAPVSSLLQQAAPPRLFFTSVSTRHKTYTVSNDRVSLPYKESGNIRISFAALAFGARDLTYEYTVSGNQQDNWQVIKNEEINLLPSGYGGHTISIRARYSSNTHSSPVSLLLTIEKPFWMLWWFILLAALCSTGLLGWMIRVVIRYFVHKKEQVLASEIKFMKLEYKALNALMNPHFIFNSLNNIQGLVNGDNRRAANEYLRIFANLIRQNMHNASKELITLEKEMELISNYLRLEKLRFNDWLHYRIDIDDHIDISGVHIPPLLVQPLVENAIRHGLVPRQSANSLLSIHIYEDEEEVLYIEISDNGVGLSNSRTTGHPSYASTGLENIRKRTAQLKLIHNIDTAFHISEIKDASGTIQGTLAVISIRPYSSGHTIRS